MARFDSGVRYYTRGIAVLEVFFPEDATVCRYCPHLRSETDLMRYWCRLTGEQVYAPNAQRGRGCPIDIEADHDVRIDEAERG